MKKMFFLACCMFASMAAFAHDEIGVEPTTFAPGDVKEVWVYLDCSTYGAKTIGAITLDIQFPEGWMVDTGAENWGDGCMWNYKFNKQGTSTNWAVSGSDKSDAEGDYVHFTLYASKTGNNFYPQSGRLFSFLVMAPDDVEVGYYPVIIRPTTVFAKDGVVANNVTWTAPQTSYVKVGEPSDATFAPKGIVPAFVNEALAAETGIKTLDLSAATAINGEFAYTVGKAVTAPAITADVKVVAGLNGGTYGSLCSPVPLPGVKCYKFTTAADGIATFTEVDDVPANEVVIINAAVNAKVAGASLVSVANGTADAGRLYVAPDGSELRRAKNSVTVPALRGTWDIAGGSNLRIALDTPTGIKMIGTANEVFGNTYDLQGRQVENAQNGVYVVNGKKQFVK